MQDMLDHWDGLLRATGGALEKQKSYWYLLDYKRSNGTWCYKSPAEVAGALLLFNGFPVMLYCCLVHRCEVAPPPRRAGQYNYFVVPMQLFSIERLLAID
jgi:hypothetical protein